MIDKELNDYIHGLLRKGYDIDSIKSNLIKSGHDISKVEKIALEVFELFHKDLIDYINKETKKGRNINLVKEDLLRLGHSEQKIKQLLNYHRKKAPLLRKIAFFEIIQKEKRWFKSWLGIYLYLFLFVIVVFLVISYFIAFHANPLGYLDMEDRLKACSAMLASESSMSLYYNKLCVALVYQNADLCEELADNSDAVQYCRDSFHIYMLYRKHDNKQCDMINNVDVRELCYQVSDKFCGVPFGYTGYCESILSDDMLRCTTKTPTPKYPILEICQDNLRIYRAIHDGLVHCEGLVHENAMNLCKAISK